MTYVSFHFSGVRRFLHELQRARGVGGSRALHHGKQAIAVDKDLKRIDDERENMRCRAPTMPLTIAIWLLLSVALDGGPQGIQTAPDRAPGGGRWMPMPLFPPGASVVLLLGDPFREAGYMYVRFPGGYEPPMHSHKATERIFVERGTLLLHLLDRDPISKPEGQYFVIKSGTVHETACAGPKDCLCYISVDRAFDVIPFPKREEF